MRLYLAVHGSRPEPPGDSFRRDVGGFAEPRGIARLDLVPQWRPYVEADLAAMAKVWLGDLPFESVLRSGAVRLVGPRQLAKAFPSWLMLSHFAGVPRPERQATSL